MVDAESALAGRETEMPVPARHEVLGTPLKGPFPRASRRRCSAWAASGAPREIFWQAPGVYTTAVGYAGGFTPNPTYEEVCSGRTGHTEVVLVAFDTPTPASRSMLKLFWEGHDPTQGMRQGNDVGTQYRSAIYWQSEAQRAAAEASREAYQEMLTRPATARSRRRSPSRTRSTMPRTTTSSTWRRTRAATAASAAPA